MDTFWWIVIVVALLAAVLFGVLVHSGLLYSPIIRVSHPASMPQRSAYVLRTGPYKKAGKEFDRLIKLVPRGTNLFGVYYDDPSKVPESKLRWIAASFLPDKEGSATERLLLSEGYQLYEFPKVERAVITDFPFKNFISILLAVWIVYPLLNQFFKNQKLTNVGPIMEVYKGDLIHYYAPLEKNHEFFVPGVEDLEGLEEDGDDDNGEEKKDK